MNQENKQFVQICVFYFLTYFSFTFSYAYLQTFLKEAGFEVLERGIILSVGAVAAIFLQFFIGYLCDRYQTNRRFFVFCEVVLLIVAWFFFRLEGGTIAKYLVLGALMCGFYRTVIAVQDAWTLEIDESYQLNFGTIRAFGSVGWAVGCPIASIIILRYGYDMMGFLFALLSVVTVFLSTGIKDAIKTEKTAKLKLSDLKVLGYNKRYLWTVLVMFLAFLAMDADGIVLTDKIMTLGGSESAIGWRSTIMAMSELPLFFLGKPVIKKFGAYRLMMFALVMLIVRFVLYGAAFDILTIIAVSALQGVTYPLFMTTSKLLVAYATPRHLSTSGQTIAQSLLTGLAVLIAPSLAGIITAYWGSNASLYVLAGLSFVALLIGWGKKKEIQGE